MGVWRLFSCNATLFLEKEKGDLSGEIRVFEGREGLPIDCVSNKQPNNLSLHFCTVCCGLEDYVLFCFVFWGKREIVCIKRMRTLLL